MTLAANVVVGRCTFDLTPEFATASGTLAANQGLYDGFQAAGLAWGSRSGRTASRSSCSFSGA
jgi:putative membrane protein